MKTCRHGISRQKVQRVRIRPPIRRSPFCTYNFILLKNDGNPISLQERACMETTYHILNIDKCVSRSYQTKQNAIPKKKAESRGVRGVFFQDFEPERYHVYSCTDQQLTSCGGRQFRRTASSQYAEAAGNLTGFPIDTHIDLTRRSTGNRRT